MNKCAGPNTKVNNDKITAPIGRWLPKDKDKFTLKSGSFCNLIVICIYDWWDGNNWYLRIDKRVIICSYD